LAKPDWRQSSFCSMLLSPWRRSRRPPDDVSRGDGPQWPSTPCRLDRRMGADRAPVRLARAEGLRAHPPAGAVRWPDLRARRRRRARPLSARCSAGWRASRQRGWRAFSAPSTPGARGCRIPWGSSRGIPRQRTAEGSFEGDLAAIKDGTGASFTVGSSPSGSPCQAGKSGTLSRVVGVPSGGVRDTGQPHAEPQALRDRALDARKGAGSKVLSRCVLHIVTPPNRNQAPHTNAPTPRQQFARSGPC
jgi:hypothetical protein